MTTLTQPHQGCLSGWHSAGSPSVPYCLLLAGVGLTAGILSPMLTALPRAKKQITSPKKKKKKPAREEVFHCSNDFPEGKHFGWSRMDKAF